MWPFSTSAYIEVSRRKLLVRQEALRAARTRSFVPEGIEESILRATGLFLSSINVRGNASLTFDFFQPKAKEIVERISKGEWTASEVLEAYISRALLSQDLTNCLTEGLQSSYLFPARLRNLLTSLNGCRLLVFFREARAQAKALDAEFASTGKIRGPLHGVPVSFKDVCQ
ncbi:hypothetical protein BD311DRAFT_185333 [Dichomitus squalens]|uniref:Amidase domain-containing protein n=1 Tax=Dichomitus squalens TaxID=114155 RepID=A0A4Q9MWI0_9APHY|nr:hypothetical protein BD311DRAFT_185333 [Dichomitus squalens]